MAWHLLFLGGLFIDMYWILIPKGVISFGIASLCFLFVESLTWFAADSECRIADVLAERDVVGLSLVLVGAKKRLVQVGFYKNKAQGPFAPTGASGQKKLEASH